jgi:hypothetical protein
MITRNCVDCGIAIQSRNGQKLRCDKHQRARNLLKKKNDMARYYRKRKRIDYKIHCEDCGAEVIAKTPTRRFCEVCRTKTAFGKQPAILERLLSEGKLHCDLVCAYFKEQVSGKDDWQELEFYTRARKLINRKLWKVSPL